MANLLPSISRHGFLSVPGDTVTAPLLGRQRLFSMNQRVSREGRVCSFVGEAGLRHVPTLTPLEARSNDNETWIVILRWERDTKHKSLKLIIIII